MMLIGENSADLLCDEEDFPVPTVPGTLFSKADFELNPVEISLTPTPPIYFHHFSSP
jgi:hypothetical protein